jgi:DNA polymerase IV
MADAIVTILHVDMDAFYASVEQRDRPELRGQPVIVGGLAGRGVVTAASYEARVFGVHSAMPIARARRLCPQGIFVPNRMERYSLISRQIREILLSFTPLVEPLSLDEAFLDIHGCEGLFGAAEAMARLVKKRIRAETGLIASVGAAPNKFLAKLASDHGKPDGLVIVPADKVVDFLAPLPVSRLWGVGKKSQERLHALGLHTVGQLAALPQTVLSDRLGDFGKHLWHLAHGLDDRRVVPDREAKSISTETTFGHDLSDREAILTCLLELVDQLAGRLRHHGLRARTIELKVRSSDFHTRTRSLSLVNATDVTEVLWQAATSLFERTVSKDVLPIRLLGVGASRLTQEAAVQGDLFESDSQTRLGKLDRTIDAIRHQFGAAAIQRGRLVGKPNQSAPDGGQEEYPGS